jgi:hypothetical protein
MWKSILLLLMAVPLSIALFFIFWATYNWRAAVIAGSSTFALCLVGATLLLLFTRSFSLFDVFLPLIFSVLWSLFLVPFSLGVEIFYAPSAIGAGIILTLCLWRTYHNDGAGKQWLIFPLLVYIYEMLPINIPGPFDDYFAFGGDIVYAILFYSKTTVMKQLPGR